VTTGVVGMGQPQIEAATVREPVLFIDNLSLAAGHVLLTEAVSLSVAPGEMVGLVGESGCGKSLTALSILRLLPEPQIRLATGRIVLEGRDVAKLTAREMTAMRGRAAGMIFQEPMTSLNPVFSIGDQIAEPLLIHKGLTKVAARKRAAGLLDRVGIASPMQMLDRYPHQLSGGQRQRVMIAIAIACEPKLLIADEPATALDVTVQAQVLELINGLRRDLGLACLLITHDLGVVAQVCDRALVMYAGRIVEEGPVDTLFRAPRHRYTRALIDTIPARNTPGSRLPAIPGQVPAPGSRGSGCTFQPRCGAALPVCSTARPLLMPSGASAVACWNPAA
jgi:oligopeptide/dipeptide ABC transporter ATP-binding protein